MSLWHPEPGGNAFAKAQGRNVPLMNTTRIAKAAAVLAVVAAIAACGGDGGGASSTPTSVTGPPTPDPRSTPALAQVIASNPQYFVYIAASGDTLASVAGTFDAQRGAQLAALVDALKSINQLATDTLAPGQQLAVPLRLPGGLSLIPDSPIEAALGIGSAAGKLVLLQPGLAMRDSYGNRIVLRFVQLADGNPSSEGFGYVMDYWLADRPPFKGGGVDPEARTVEPLFSVAGGSLAGRLQSGPAGPVHTFTRDGVSYSVRAATSAGKTPAELVALLQTSAQR